VDAAELALVRSSLESALRDTAGAEIPAVLAKLGWDELWEVEPAVAVAELFEAQGRLATSTPALDLVVTRCLGIDLPEGSAVVHPALQAWNDLPGSAAGDGTILVDGLVLGGVTRARTVLVPTPGADGRVILAAVDSAGLEAEEVAGLDEDLRLVRIRGRAVPGRAEPRPRSWPEVTSVARRALGHELVGLAQAMLDAAGRHVTDRVQFGRPVAGFQAVRHRLADLHVAIAAARAALDTAGTSVDPLAADGAKALAGQAGLLAATHCLQVTGAIGFTWEHELHRRIRRVHLIDGLYGRAGALQGTIGARLLARRAVPRLGGMDS
jgi:hypothetical protein